MFLTKIYNTFKGITFSRYIGLFYISAWINSVLLESV